MTDRSSRESKRDSRRDDEREIDRGAIEGDRSEWLERSASSAGDPLTDVEKKGLSILAQADPRGDGSIEGVSAPKEGDVGDNAPIAGSADNVRRNPPLVEDAGLGDGGISASGGAAGGA
ncbi:hypothetical protein [Roseisolibacter agri]|uniref:Uncharacterized protein n=1 Tax=Roseisolibacter agri TaxID=2014610 RepID=A0AA37QJX1_9BACT|nr:hypothetical protein [Roseisolibacter agri]GLC27870.1 hypothetical protein rosag_43830 [Roseisolibacter agri]